MKDDLCTAVNVNVNVSSGRLLCWLLQGCWLLPVAVLPAMLCSGGGGDGGRPKDPCAYILFSHFISNAFILFFAHFQLKTIFQFLFV